MNGSPNFALSSTDVQKIATGALMAVGGALATYLLNTVLPQLKEQGEINAALFVLFSTLINAARKFITDTVPTA
jgi:predicted metal-dependent phosphotriesterase family hydrolase